MTQISKFLLLLLTICKKKKQKDPQVSCLQFEELKVNTNLFEVAATKMQSLSTKIHVISCKEFC